MPGKGNRALRIWQLGLFAAVLLVAWYVLTSPTLLPPLYFDDPHKAAFFFGEPLKVAGAHLGLVLVGLHLPAPVGHAGGNRARLRASAPSSGW